MKKLSPAQQIPELGTLTLGDFWSWAYSDLLCNVNRSLFAEFLVGTALGVTDTPRLEWDAVDLEYMGRKIEVKASAYLQSWQQERPSSIRYDIAKKQPWDARTNTYSDVPVRSADCYVFCLYSETDRARASFLDVAAWQFYALSTDQIEQDLGEQKSVGLARIRSMCSPVGYHELRQRLHAVLGLGGSTDAEVAPSLRRLATCVDVHPVLLPDGTYVRIPKWTIQFPPADPDRLPADALARTYTSKPLVDVEGEPLFGELAIVRWLQKDGWDAVWVDSYHDKGRHKLFWQGLPDRTEPFNLAQVPMAWERYSQVVEANGGRAAGFFDVLAWQGERFLFIEYKGTGDRPNANEAAWVQAALSAGVHEGELLYVAHPG